MRCQLNVTLLKAVLQIHQTVAVMNEFLCGNSVSDIMEVAVKELNLQEELRWKPNQVTSSFVVFHAALVCWHAAHMEPRSKTSPCCTSNQVSALKRKLQNRNEKVDDLQKQSGLIADSASEPFEEKATERIAESDTPRKISRKLSRAGQAVTETEMEMDSLTAEIDGLKQRLEEVMGQSWACIL